MLSQSGASTALSTDEFAALDKQRRKMLADEGYKETEGEEAEDGDAALVGSSSGSPGCQALLAEVQSFSTLIGFMVWNGAKALADDVKEARRKREEWEALWFEKIERQKKLGQASKSIHDASARPAWVASGQLMAHFTYLCLGGALTGEDVVEPAHRFGLKCVQEVPRPQPRRGSDLHKALASGQVMIDAAIGRGFGKDSLQLALRNRSSDVCQVVIQQGTIFQHVDWQHRQNLLVAVDYVISVPAGGVASKKLMAYCMNLSCACSNGNSMELTEFYFDDLEVLQDQSKVWDHFQRSFGLR
jgi:hypothetical protein